MSNLVWINYLEYTQISPEGKTFVVEIRDHGRGSITMDPFSDATLSMLGYYTNAQALDMVIEHIKLTSYIEFKTAQEILDTCLLWLRIGDGYLLSRTQQLAKAKAEAQAERAERAQEIIEEIEDQAPSKRLNVSE